MKNKTVDNVKVGLFVLAGILFLILTLYMISKNRNLLGDTITIKAIINNVNGLVPGNNVRFKGIDVGTVKSIKVENDSSISVYMLIDKKMQSYIKKNAIASIGTDGLMGNKLININSQPGIAESIEPGDVILSIKPVETEEMLRTLNITNNNIEKITQNLFEITTRLNTSNSLWKLLADTTINTDLRQTVGELRLASTQTREITTVIKDIAMRYGKGKGFANQIFTDTTLARQLTSSMKQIEYISTQASSIVTDLKTMTEKTKQGNGATGLLLSDSVFRQKLAQSALNIEQGTARFNQNMEALKGNFLFKGYFKKLEKKEKKEKNKN